MVVYGGGSGGPAFPVAFFDGEREMDIGDVRINPAMEYKSFQLMLSGMIGISPNQISIYLVNRKRNRKSQFSDDRRRIPVTGKANFGAICRQKECCFLVILKRSRKSRSRRERTISSSGGIVCENDSSPAPVRPVPEQMILLRRSRPASFWIAQSEVDDLNGRFRRLGVGGDLQSPLLNGGVFPAIDSTWLVTKKNEGSKVLCEKCTKSGGTVSFHPCINDAVITGFSTRLGPINRPDKCL